jgi:hypothetical protein
MHTSGYAESQLLPPLEGIVNCKVGIGAHIPNKLSLAYFCASEKVDVQALSGG